MAMNVGSSSASGAPDVMIDINTTPLIDVMLVLLIMLIITIPIQLHSVELNLPQGNPPPPLVEPEVVRINIESDNTIFWNGEAITGGVETLEPRLASAAAQGVQPELHVRPDRAASYATVAAVMAAIQRNHLTKIGLVGSEQFL
ncbi:biopolymer transporter ExbD [Betaproteobacteria bacterium]|nr:biopolymer transporter ExbD [Betaproteobacteria bacterium]GHU06737.1 biopolymer transporter ExbD [Betaproteobacteria bacterium]